MVKCHGSHLQFAPLSISISEESVSVLVCLSVGESFRVKRSSACAGTVSDLLHKLERLQTDGQTDGRTDATKRIISPASRSIIRTNDTE